MISQRKKEEDGLVGAAVPLHLDENAQLAESIQGKMDHQSSTIFPEQVELIRMWLRALLKKYEEADFAKISTVPHRGEMDTTGYSDYLYFCGQLLALHIGANGGHRTGDYAKLATTNFAVVEQAHVTALGWAMECGRLRKEEQWTWLQTCSSFDF